MYADLHFRDRVFRSYHKGVRRAKLSVTFTSFGGQSDGVSNYNVGFSAGAARTLRVSSSGIIPDARRSVWGDCRQGQHVADGGAHLGQYQIHHVDFISNKHRRRRHECSQASIWDYARDNVCPLPPRAAARYHDGSGCRLTRGGFSR